MQNGISLKKIWQERKKILEGITNKVFKKEFIEHVSEYRMNICNKCEYKSNNCSLPGDCCSICGCNLELKTRSLSSNCGLEEKNEEPKWKAIVSTEEEVDYDLLDI